MESQHVHPTIWSGWAQYVHRGKGDCQCEGSDGLGLADNARRIYRWCSLGGAIGCGWCQGLLVWCLCRRKPWWCGPMNPRKKWWLQDHLVFVSGSKGVLLVNMISNTQSTSPHINIGVSTANIHRWAHQHWIHLISTHSSSSRPFDDLYFLPRHSLVVSRRTWS